MVGGGPFDPMKAQVQAFLSQVLPDRVAREPDQRLQRTSGRMTRSDTLLARAGALLIAGAIVGCAAAPSRQPTAGEEAAAVRIVNFVVAEGSEAAWSSACRRLAVAAAESRLDANWLIHRIDDRNYYLVTFGDRADFEDPNSIVEGFRRHDIEAFKAEVDQLHSVAYSVSSDEVWEQIPAWSTTSDMNSLTHPGVDQRSYRVHASELAAVDSVLTEMADLLNREHYPFPTEGFRVGRGQEVDVHVVSFFRARDEYYSNGRPEAFLATDEARQQWERLAGRLDAITLARSRTEARYMHELSYDPWLLEQSPESGG